MVCGSEEIKKTIEKHLGIMEGETTADGMFTLREVYIVYMYIYIWILTYVYERICKWTYVYILQMITISFCTHICVIYINFDVINMTYLHTHRWNV
jgi:hypothetical protein